MTESNMNSKLSQILLLARELTTQELMSLNQEIVSLIKTYRDLDFSKAAFSYKKGDIVSFTNTAGIKEYGVITRKNPKTLQVTTQSNYYINIPATYLTLEDAPSANLLEFKKTVAPTYEDMYETLNSVTEKDILSKLRKL